MYEVGDRVDVVNTEIRLDGFQRQLLTIILSFVLYALAKLRPASRNVYFRVLC